MTDPTPVRLTTSQARRIALAAQGFLDPRPEPGAATTRHVQRVLDRVQVVQIDSVNVVTRSQYLPFFSRLGPYDTALLDRARDRAPRRVVEYWAHEASLVPPTTWPLLDFRMRRARDDSWGGMQRVARDHPELVEAVYEEVLARGPLTSRQLEAALEHDLPRERDHWGWNWSLVKNALEHLFWSGRISSAGRTSQFERRYASLERVLPPRVLAVAGRPEDRPDDATAFRALVELSARAHGVGAVIDLRAEAQPDPAGLASLGVDFLHLPTPDMAGVSQSMLDRGVAFARSAAARRRRLLVHCQHGIGRSATLALCVLADRGTAPLEALLKLKTAREIVSPSPEQYEAWMAWLARRTPHLPRPSFHDFGCIAYRHLAGA